MAFSFSDDTQPLGVQIPGVPPAAPVEAISGFERAVARNLRQPTTCGKEWIRALLDDPTPDAETKLAALVAESGGRSLRENEAGLKAQLRAAFDRAERYRRALETLAANAHFAPSQYPPELREILTTALGRPY